MDCLHAKDGIIWWLIGGELNVRNLTLKISKVSFETQTIQWIVPVEWIPQWDPIDFKFVC